MIELFDLFCEGAQAFVFRIRSERPIDFLVVGRPELDFVEAVLFVEGKFAFELQLGLVDFFQKLFEDFLLFEVGFLFGLLSARISTRAGSRKRRPSFAAAASYS